MSKEPIANINDFPLLSTRSIEGRSISYLDSAATALKPKSVIQAVTSFYEQHCANIHRGDHALSQEASGLFEDARHAVASFIGATSREIVFTAGTTDSLNRVSEGLDLKPDENVIVSLIDHHSNILPWMGRCEVRYLPLNEEGCTDIDALDSMIDDKTRLVALGHVSNVTGAITDVKRAAQIARTRGVLSCIDAAQSVPHFRLDVVDLGCDFLAFSSHKMLGPSGCGVLYVQEDAAPRLRTLRLGGGTPDHVRRSEFDLKEMPHRMEPGTPNIEGVCALGAAIAYLEALGMDEIYEHDKALTRVMHELFGDSEYVQMIGPEDPDLKVSIASLVPRSNVVTVGSLGHYLSDSKKIMARSGTHCAHPYFESIACAGTIRLSAYVYTSERELRAAAEALDEFLGRGKH